MPTKKKKIKPIVGPFALRYGGLDGKCKNRLMGLCNRLPFRHYSIANARGSMDFDVKFTFGSKKDLEKFDREARSICR